MLKKWYEWVDSLRKKAEEKEKERLIQSNLYKGKKYCCTSCGEEKPTELFAFLNNQTFCGETVYGDYVTVSVRNGKGKCKSCEQKEQEEYDEWMKEYKRKWYQSHKAEISARQRERRRNNNESNKAWQASHREQINQHIRERKQKDSVFKLKCQARTAIYQSFKRTGHVKQNRCESITGLKIDDLVSYLCDTYEKTYGKKWDGVEPIHIDHIIPLATAQSEEDVKRLCHYTNLQLLTAQDNLMKGSKYA